VGGDHLDPRLAAGHPYNADMTLRMRLLPFAAADGATNMAADEAMLESASERSVASLRFYTWAEPTLSLGYFQPAADRERLAPGPWVRRSTGGAGILHHRELTYSFALPAHPAWKSEEPWICRMHRLVRDVLRDRVVESRVVACGEEVKRGEVLCFLHHTAGDLAIGESKVAGSAQRKMRSALLQHGSLLLRKSEFAPELPGMCDLAGRELFTAEELAELLTARFASATGAMIEPGDWTAAERDRTAAIRAAKYANAEWNGRR
jgi:lipoyl(octanoyl) transferase